MKAITVYQPYASLIATENKIYETRACSTKYRGPIAIHAAQKVDDDVFRFLICPLSTMRELYKCGVTERNVDDLPRGAIIATAELVDVWRIETSVLTGEIRARKLNSDNRPSVTEIYPTHKEKELGDWRPGRYAWELRNVKILPEPIPAKGKSSLWDWNPEAATKEADDNE